MQMREKREGSKREVKSACRPGNNRKVHLIEQRRWGLQEYDRITNNNKYPDQTQNMTI